MCFFFAQEESSPPSVVSPLTSDFPLWLVFDLLSVDTVMFLLAALLTEQRILLHSHSYSSLTLVAQCMLQLFSPLQVRVYLRVLPRDVSKR